MLSKKELLAPAHQGRRVELFVNHRPGQDAARGQPHKRGIASGTYSVNSGG